MTSTLLSPLDGIPALGLFLWGDSTTNFSGIFDGDGHAISGLYINATTVNYVGLFGYSANTIKNVTLNGESITAVGVAGSNGTNGLAGTNGTTPTVGGQERPEQQAARSILEVLQGITRVLSRASM